MPKYQNELTKVPFFMITNYENGRYQDKGLNNLNNMGNMNIERPERVNVLVPEINNYLRWLRNEISN